MGLLKGLKDTSLFRVFGLIWPEMRPRLGHLFLVVGLATVVTFGEKAPLLLIKPLFDRVLFPAGLEVAQAAEEPAPELPVGGTLATVDAHAASVQELYMGGFDRLQGTVAGWIGSPESLSEAEVTKLAALFTVAGLILIVTLIAAVAQYASTWTSRWLALRLVVDMRLRLARHLMALSMRYHGARRFGDLLSRVSADVNQTLTVVRMALRDMVQQPLLILGSLAVAAVSAPIPTLLVVLFLPLIAVPIALLGRKVRKRSTRSLASLGSTVEVLTQMIRGIRTVKAFRAEDRELENYRHINEDYVKKTMGMARAVATIDASTTVLSNLGFAGLVLLLGWFSLREGWFDTPGDMPAFILGISLIYTHTKRVTRSVNHLQEAAGAAERLQNLLDEPIDIEDRPGARDLEGLGAGLEFKDVSFTYPATDRPAVDRLSLHLRPGETLALVGPSGAGKTTLIDLIARFIDVDEGVLTVDGVDLRQIRQDSWAELYAMVGQEPFLFHTTVLENIRYGKHDATQAEVEEAARAANIHEFIQSLPAGYQTEVGDMGERLSGGQRQRLTIARAILKGAPLLLLDEATSALDSESEAEVQKALDELMQGRTVIVIAHRLSTIQGADRIAVLDQGRLVELGSHRDLLEAGGVYARLHAVQFRSDREPARG